MSDPLGGGAGGNGVYFNNFDGTSITLRPVFTNNLGGIVRGGTGGQGADSVDPGFAGGGGDGVSTDANFSLINNYGTISGGDGGALSGYGGDGGKGIFAPANNIIINNYGTITGGNGSNGSLVAAGAGGYGVYALTAGATLNNYGTISSGLPGTLPSLAVINHAVTLNGSLYNSGTINGSITGSLINFTNSGTINSSGKTIVSSSGNDVFTQNDGTITANLINLSSGLNTININGGIINSSIATSGTGADTFNMAGGTYNGSTSLVNGANIFNMTGGTYNGNLTTGTGADTFRISGGTLTGIINLGTGNDTFFLSGGDISGTTIDLNTGTDTVAFINDYTLATSFAPTGAEEYRIESGGLLDFEAGRSLFADLTINSGGRVNVINGDLTDINTLQNDGTLFLGAGRTVSTTIQNLASGHFIFEVASPSSAGYLTSPNDIGLSGSSISVSVASNATLADNDEILIANSTTGVIYGFDNLLGQALTAISDDSFLWDFSVADGSQPEITSSSSNSELYLIADQIRTLSDTATLGNNLSLSESLEPLLSTSSDPQVTALQTRINAAGSADEINRILGTLQPNLDQSPAILNDRIARGITRQINSRINYLRTANASSTTNRFQADFVMPNSFKGLSLGPTESDSSFKKSLYDMALGIKSGLLSGLPKSVWVKGFGSKIKQGSSNGVSGFDSRDYGITLGADTEIEQGRFMGMALTFADGKIESSNTNATETDLQTYQLSVYGGTELPHDMYMNGSLSYAWNDVQSVRNNLGGLGLNSYADYTNDYYGLDTSVGKIFSVGENTTLNLSGLANYKYYNSYDYTEQGAGGISLDVQNDSSQTFEVGFNVDVSSDFHQDNGSVLTPFLSFGYRYDLIGDTFATHSNFVAGGNAFESTGAEPERGTTNIGLGLDFVSGQNWDIRTNYDYEYKENYDSHSAQITSRWKF